MNTVEAPLVDNPPSPLASRSGWGTATMLGGILTVALTAIFLGSLFNRFITIHDNWQNYYAQMMRQGRMPYRDFYFFTQPLLLVAGILWAYSSGTSHVAHPYAVILGVAYLIASACDTLRSRGGAPLLGIVAALGLFQIGETAWQKYSDPYDWNGWRSTFSHGAASSHWPQLAGFKLDQSTVDFFDTVLDDIAPNSRPGEPIFTFPTIPLFNFVTGRPQPTFCAVFYWDVCSDSVAEADAARVRAARPAIIVDLDLDEWVRLQVEEVFRGGRRSGQRSIQEAIRQMTSPGDYRLLHSLKTPFYKMPLNVWNGLNDLKASRV